jgi:hypothetical protein
MLNVILDLRVLKDKSINLHIIKFIKGIIIIREEHLIKNFIQNDYFPAVFEIYLENWKKENLLKSSIIELIDLIAKDNFKKLFIYVVIKIFFKKKLDLF